MKSHASAGRRMPDHHWLDLIKGGNRDSFGPPYDQGFHIPCVPVEGRDGKVDSLPCFQKR